MDEFNTGWDPYEQLILAKDNIQQLAAAYNQHQIHLNNLTARVNHQQEVIEQLVHQINKLNQIIQNRLAN